MGNARADEQVYAEEIGSRNQEEGSRRQEVGIEFKE